MVERCKLAQWGPWRSYGKMRFWCISGLEQSTNLDSSLLVGRFQLLELCKKNSYYNIVVYDTAPSRRE